MESIFLEPTPELAASYIKEFDSVEVADIAINNLMKKFP